MKQIHICFNDKEGRQYNGLYLEGSFKVSDFRDRGYKIISMEEVQ